MRAPPSARPSSPAILLPSCGWIVNWLDGWMATGVADPYHGGETGPYPRIFLDHVRPTPTLESPAVVYILKLVCAIVGRLVRRKRLVQLPDLLIRRNMRAYRRNA